MGSDEGSECDEAFAAIMCLVHVGFLLLGRDYSKYCSRCLLVGSAGSGGLNVSSLRCWFWVTTESKDASQSFECESLVDRSKTSSD